LFDYHTTPVAIRSMVSLAWQDADLHYFVTTVVLQRQWYKLFLHRYVVLPLDC
jgi:hypothetical protein